jgi:ABC-type nitrate/sulfonate/bicarbonate transport system permease component
MMSGLRLLAWELWLPILIVVVWYFGSESSKSPYFPPLSRIWKAFVDNWFGPGFAHDVVPSLTNLAFGLAVALVVGVGAGLLLALFPLAADIADPFLQFFRAIPALAVLPALFIVFGTGSTGNVAGRYSSTPSTAFAPSTRVSDWWRAATGSVHPSW